MEPAHGLNTNIELVKREPVDGLQTKPLWEMTRQERRKRLAELRKELTDGEGD